jgi:hypothetical protein
VKIKTAEIIIIAIPAVIHNGLKTHHHDQSIIWHNFNVININNNKDGKIFSFVIF